MKRLATITLFFLLLSGAHAAITDFKTLKASFEQRIVNDQNQTIIYRGTLYIKQPGLILWDYTSPIKKSIYISRYNVTVYEPELYQAIIFQQKEELNPIKVFNESKSITPTKRLSVYNDREITIMHEKDRVTHISFKDKVDNDVRIDFVTYEKNIDLDDKLFVFEPVEGIDIIRQ